MFRLNVKTNKSLKDIELGTVVLNWTRHAVDQLKKKNVPFYSNLLVSKGTVVEEERDRNNVRTKIVVRIHDSAEWDAVYVLVPRNGYYTVVTCWKNRTTDNHLTLNLNRLGKVA